MAKRSTPKPGGSSKEAEKFPAKKPGVSGDSNKERKALADKKKK